MWTYVFVASLIPKYAYMVKSMCYFKWYLPNITGFKAEICPSLNWYIWGLE